MSEPNRTQAAGDAPRTLYIIDAFAQIFRAYYAIMGGMNSEVTGEPTNVTFGFAGMLLKLLRQYKPTYLVVAGESKGKVFREELDPEYKANRDAAPEDLTLQVPRVFEMCRLFGIPVVSAEGAEADDVIATLAKRTQQDDRYSDVRVRIVSKDKDLEALINSRVDMLDVHKDEAIDAEALYAKKGYTPEQVLDVLTLTGDTADNIRGVKGIGPKTVAKLLNEFGDVDTILANLDKIKGKRRENLEEAKAWLPLTRQLVKLKDDVDLSEALGDDLEAARVGAVNGDALRELFHELGFRRHLSDLDALIDGETAGNDATANATASPTATPGTTVNPDSNQGFLFDMGGAATAEAQGDEAYGDNAAQTLGSASDGEYRGIMDREALNDLIAMLRDAGSFSIDTETIGLGREAGLCGISIAWQEGEAVYIPTVSPEQDQHLNTEEVIEALRPLLEDAAVKKIGHNIKYDLHVLRNAGLKLRGVINDTMVAAFLLQYPAQGMDWLATEVLKHKMIPITQLIGPPPKGKKGTPQKTMDRVPLDEVTPYAAEDADITHRLHRVLTEQLAEQGMTQLAEQIEMPLVEVLTDMEHAGIKLDADELMRQKEGLASRIDELRGDIIEAAGGYVFNVDSPKQLAEVLFKRLNLPVVKKTKTGPSTDMEVLQKLADREDLDPQAAKVPELVLEYRQITKLVNTYLDALREQVHPATGRIHATFHQTGAATGRLSSSDPNLQNIPIRTEMGRQIRKAFIAERGHKLVAADYSQIELRLLAHLSDDEALIDAFRREMDIHTAVAMQVFEVSDDEVTTQQRTHAKTINFGIIYGVTPHGLARRIENLDLNGAKELISEYHRRFPGISRFLDTCVMQAERDGYVTTMMGRRRAIPQIKSRNGNTRALGERLAINTVVQGSAADLIKLAMVNLHRKIENDVLPMRLLLQIHDELVVETPEAAADATAATLKQVMESAMELKVPLRVETGAGVNWYEAK